MRTLPYTQFLIVIAVVAINCVTSPAKADDKAKIQAANALIDRSGMAAHWNQMLNDQLDVKIKEDPALAPYKGIYLKYLHKYLTFDAVRPGFVKMFAKDFTAEELNQMERHYQTPAGKKAAKMMPKIFAQGFAVGEKAAGEHRPELLKAIAAEKAKLEKQKQ